MLAASSPVWVVGQEDDSSKVSYYQHIRPVFQAKCHGCHQPAKPEGDYVMTHFERLIQGGESGGKAILPGNAAQSYLVELITPVNGKAEMPRKEEPLSSVEIDLVRRWIDQGAINDTPPNAVPRYDLENPPVYQRPPLITSLDYSPDGRWLAVSGFHEVLLHKADGSGLEKRLIGLSQRIESVRFSPDATKTGCRRRLSRSHGGTSDLGCRQWRTGFVGSCFIRHRLWSQLVA
jgi:mono/diheme cytochrome c family protein